LTIRRAAFVAAAASLAALALAAGCRTPKRATDRGGVYDSRSLKFHHGTLPDEWKRTKVEGTSLAFDNRPLDATISLFANCKDIEDVSLRALVQQELVGLENKEVLERREDPVGDREAADWVVRGELDGVTVQMNLVVLRIGGCVYDLVLVADPQTFEKARADFKVFVGGFEVIK